MIATNAGKNERNNDQIENSHPSGEKNIKIGSGSEIKMSAYGRTDHLDRYGLRML
jgi:hypothetical protein